MIMRMKYRGNVGLVSAVGDVEHNFGCSSAVFHPSKGISLIRSCLQRHTAMRHLPKLTSTRNSWLGRGHVSEVVLSKGEDPTGKPVKVFITPSLLFACFCPHLALDSED